MRAYFCKVCKKEFEGPDEICEACEFHLNRIEKPTLAEQWIKAFENNKKRDEIFKQLVKDNPRNTGCALTDSYSVKLKDGSILSLIDNEYWDINNT